jgi:urease subunit gamma/beta
MHLTPHEMEKLLLSNAGLLAQRRLARGVRLNYPESVALISTVTLEFIRDGKSVAELMELGKQLLGRRQVMSGVPELIADVQVEGTFPDGTKLVSIHHPIESESGDLALALYGSLLPVPAVELFSLPEEASLQPGRYEAGTGDLVLNAGREVTTLPVTNEGTRPIQVGSHYHFVETNQVLLFDRADAYGKRLDIPAGTAIRFEPGETKEVHLVEIAGARIIHGGNNLADGPVSAPAKEAALTNIESRNFANRE